MELTLLCWGLDPVRPRSIRIPFLIDIHKTMSGPGIQEIIVIGLIFILSAVMLGIQIWAIIHCIKNPDLSDTNRIVGVVLIAVLGVIGALIYLFIPREPSDQSGD